MSLTMPRDREKYKLTLKKWRENNKSLVKENNSNYYKNNPDYFKQYHKKNPLVKTKFSWKHQGIICDYDAIYDIYINTHKCDHCDKDLTNKNRTLDHCHTCGTVRGILCKPCNRLDKLNCYLC